MLYPLMGWGLLRRFQASIQIIARSFSVLARGLQHFNQNIHEVGTDRGGFVEQLYGDLAERLELILLASNKVPEETQQPLSREQIAIVDRPMPGYSFFIVQRK
jgi:hypothetical protein